MASRRIRIVHCIGSLEVGGAERQLVELVTRLPSDRFEQSLVLFHAEDELSAPIEDAGCEVVKLRPPRHDAARVRTLASRSAGVVQLVRYLRDVRPHVVHGQLDLANIASVIGGRLADVPVIVTSERNLCRDPEQRSLRQRALNRANRTATAVVANSRAVADGLVEHSRVDPDRVRLIYNGVDERRFAAEDRPAHAARVRARFGITPADRVIGSVGNMHWYKGHADLVRAFAALEPHRRRLKLLILGRDMGAWSRCRSLASELGVADSVVSAGLVEEVADVLPACELVVHPSQEEGFSNAILEAMSAGKPVIACAVGGNVEAVVDGETGTLVPVNDPPTLAAAIDELLGDRARAASFGRAGRERVERRFRVDRMIADYTSLYTELVGQVDLAPEPVAGASAMTNQAAAFGIAPNGPP